MCTLRDIIMNITINISHLFVSASVPQIKGASDYLWTRSHQQTMTGDQWKDALVNISFPNANNPSSFQVNQKLFFFLNYVSGLQILRLAYCFLKNVQSCTIERNILTKERKELGRVNSKIFNHIFSVCTIL